MTAGQDGRTDVTWLRDRRRLLVALSFGLLLLLLAIEPDYGSLQVAATPEAFRAIVEEGTGRFVAAALVDVLFAVAYGLGGFSLTIDRRTSVAGAVLIAAGALFDELENLTLLRNIGRADDLGQGAVDLMGRFGQVKYGLIAAGLAVLFLAWAWSKRQLVADWAFGPARVWIRYLVFVVVLLAVVPAAYARNMYFTVPILAVLAWAAVKLNACVRADRDGARAAGTSDHGQARLVLATLQLAVGAGLTLWGTRADGRLADIAFFLGVALIVMSLGSYVSELRQNPFLGTGKAVSFAIAAFGLLVYATAVDPGTAIPLVVAGLLLGELATELLSERFLRADALPLPGWLVSAIGAGTLLLAVAMLVNGGADPGHLLPIVAVLAVVVVMASADGDALIIVGIVAVALVWAVSPTETVIADERQPEPGEPYFVVFGDSYISGEGAERFIEGTNEKVDDPDPDSAHTSECRRATTAWPFVVADLADAAGSDVVPERVLFLACSGAVTENIHTERRLEERPDGTRVQHGPAELRLFLDEVRRLELGPPAFAVVSVGGNDAGFGEIGQTCLAPGNCAEVAQQFLDAEERRRSDQPVEDAPGKGGPEALAWIDDDLDAAYARLRAALPDVPVIAVPYPIPLTTSGRCRGVLLDDDERRFIRGFVPQLNDAVRAAAGRKGLHVMDTMEDALRSRGSQLCSSSGSGRSGLNFLALNPTAGSLADSVNPKNWTHNSLHPNAAGHRAMAKTAYSWLSTNLPDLPSPPPSGSPHPVPLLGDVFEDDAPPQCLPEDRPSCRVAGGRWVGEEVHAFYARSLFPGAVVVIGLWLLINPVLRWAHRQTPPITTDLLISRPGRRAARRTATHVGRWLWDRRAPW